MKFVRRKLSKAAADTLRRCPIAGIEPYSLMLGPVYIFMKLNGKFISVKEPLDFFEPEELEKLSHYENFYFEKFIDQAIAFREVGRALRRLLMWRSESSSLSKTSSPAVSLVDVAKNENTLPSYMTGDAILRLITPLFGDHSQIEPYFLTLFVDEFCGPLNAIDLKTRRDEDVETYEWAMHCSSLTILFLTILNAANLDFFNAARSYVFNSYGRDTDTANASNPKAVLQHKDFQTSFRYAESICKSMRKAPRPTFKVDFIRGIDEPALRKIISRFERIETSLREQVVTFDDFSIYSNGGFAQAEDEPGVAS